MPQARIDELWIYPVKSCRGTPLSSALLGPRGLVGDREWMIVDQRDRFITQRTHPQLARIVATLADDTLTLSADGAAPLTLPRGARDLHGKLRRVQIWRDAADAIDAGDEAARWCGVVLGASVRLVRASEATLREPAL